MQTNMQPPITQQEKGGVGQFLKNYLKQSLEIVKHPLKLLPTIVLGWSSAGRIARLTEDSPTHVRSVLDRFESRCKRGLPAQQRGRFDALFGEIARRQLAGRAGVPHPASVYRAFEAEASRLEVPEHRLSRVIFRVVVFLMALVCAVLFWLFAVLVQSPDIEPPAEPAPTPQSATVETVV